jgi:hypothetical protein
MRGCVTGKRWVGKKEGAPESKCEENRWHRRPPAIHLPPKKKGNLTLDTILYRFFSSAFSRAARIKKAISSTR